MRHPFPLVLAAGLALAAASLASAGTFGTRVAGSEDISLKYGAGYASIWDRGSVLGWVRRGRIKVRNLPGRGAPRGTVTGCETRHGSLKGTLICGGRDLRFRIYGTTWKVQIQGRGINVSGVIRGYLALDRADGGTGIYSIGGESYRRWPATVTVFRVRS